MQILPGAQQARRYITIVLPCIGLCAVVSMLIDTSINPFQMDPAWGWGVGRLAWKSKICISLLLAHLKTNGVEWSWSKVFNDLPKLERERGNKFGTWRPILRSGLGPWKTRCIDHPTPMTLSIRFCLFTIDTWFQIECLFMLYHSWPWKDP